MARHRVLSGSSYPRSTGIFVSAELQDCRQLLIEAHRHDAEIHNRGGTIGPGKELCSQPRLKAFNVDELP